MKKLSNRLSAATIVALITVSVGVSQKVSLAQAPTSNTGDKPSNDHIVIGGYDARSQERREADLLTEQQAKMGATAGDRALAEGHLLEAIQQYQQSTKAIPSPMYNSDTYVHLGDAYQSLGRYEDAVAAYDKLWTRDNPQRPPIFWVTGTFRAAALLKYAMLLKRTGRTAEALSAYNKAIDDGFIKRGYAGANFADAHIDVTEQTVNTTEFDIACDLGMGAALISGDRSQAIPYLLEVTRQRPHLALGHFYLAIAMRNWLPPAVRKEAESRTSWRAEFQKAAQTGSGSLKASAEAMAK